MNPKGMNLRGNFELSILRLEEVLALPKDYVILDSAIHRFKIAFELCWKLLKAFLEEEHNSTCTSPRTCFKAAFKNNVIDDDPFWIDLTKLRNYAVHTYNEELAEYVYERLPASLEKFKQALKATKAN